MNATIVRLIITVEIIQAKIHVGASREAAAHEKGSEWEFVN